MIIIDKMYLSPALVGKALIDGPPRFFCPLTMTACRPTDRGSPSPPIDKPDRPLMVYIPGLEDRG
jgi:hypothetical protein